MCMLKHPTTSFISVFFRTLADIPLASFALKRCRQAFDVKLRCNFSSSPNILTRTFLAFAEKFCSFFCCFFSPRNHQSGRQREETLMNLMLRTIKHRYGLNLSPYAQREQPEALCAGWLQQRKKTSWIHLMRTNNPFNLSAISFPQRKRPEGAVEKGE